MKWQYKIGLSFVLAIVFVLIMSPGIWHEEQTVENDLSSMKFILLWTSPEKDPLRPIVKGQQAFIERNCTVFNCYVTSKITLFNDITEFDAILFHYPEIFRDKSYNLLPKRRSDRQIYVFVSKESSVYYPAPEWKFDNYFNMTWTYKLDSDLYFGDVIIRNDNGEVIGPSDNINWLKVDEMLPVNETIKYKLRSKDKAGAWFVSNCKTFSERNVLMDELQRELNNYNLSIDVYGKCGSKQCPKNKRNYCLDLIEKYYFFYFSLENSFSTDYVTEKLLNALSHYAVPVVYGDADYKRYLIYLLTKNLKKYYYTKVL